MTKRLTRIKRKLVPARAEVVQETTTRVKEPVNTVVHTPTTLAEAIGDPLVEVPEKQERTKVVRKIVHKKRAA